MFPGFSVPSILVFSTYPSSFVLYFLVFTIASSDCFTRSEKCGNNSLDWFRARKKKIKIKGFRFHRTSNSFFSRFTCKHFSSFTSKINSKSLRQSANSCEHEPVTACRRALNFTPFLRVRLCYCVHVRFIFVAARNFWQTTHKTRIGRKKRQRPPSMRRRTKKEKFRKKCT